jgi:hypothetical protein
MNETPNKTPGTLFIAWSGKKQVGKDTATAFAEKMLIKAGKTVGITAFAESLKDVAINVLGIDRRLVYGSNDDKETPTHILWDTFPMDTRMKYSNESFDERVFSGPRPMHRSGTMTVREVLQVMGTDIFRVMFENDVWAHSPFRRDWAGFDVVFITDCRFPNEKRITEEHGGIIIRLERDTGFMDNHSSETALDDTEFGRIYSNNGTLNDLRNFVKQTLSELRLL